MILLGIILLIIGVFAARNILWPIGGILILIGIVLLLTTPSYGYYLTAMSTAQIYKDTTGQWRYRIKANNGETIATGESYHNLEDCIDTAQQLHPDRIDMVDQ